MVGGANPLVSASVSAGNKSILSKGSGSNEGGKKKKLHATYNFPRVRLFLDENTIAVSLLQNRWREVGDALAEVFLWPRVKESGNLRILL